MMELYTINQVSKLYGISTRMLYYYEKIGLISSLRKSEYAVSGFMMKLHCCGFNRYLFYESCVFL